MTHQRDSAPNMAIFCDFENVAIGVRDARYDAFAIEMCLERLLDKGKIVVKKAYADWDRYRSSKRSMHEAAFEMIEIPHVSYSGKNSADIRMVVDALDLCYTKPHIDFFVIISGDSDFSPLVSKLRENDKIVIGLGVKNSSSDLLIENCDEFIYYDDLVRARRASKKKKGKKRRPPARDRNGSQSERAQTDKSDKPSPDKPSPDKPSPDKAGTDKASSDRATRPKKAEDKPERAKAAPNERDEATDKSGDRAAADGNDALSPEEEEERRQEGLDHVLDVIEALFQDRDSHLWGSMVKQTLKRKRPNFSERFHGYRTFSELLEDARTRGLLELSKDERSGGYLITSFGPNA